MLLTILVLILLVLAFVFLYKAAFNVPPPAGHNVTYGWLAILLLALAWAIVWLSGDTYVTTLLHR